MRTLPPLGLLLDVDGPLASPETRRVPPAVLDVLGALGRQGIPVVFNTGRSARFVLEHLARPLVAAGLPPQARFHAVCEKGAVWFSLAELPRPDSVTGQEQTPDAGPNAGLDRTALPGWLHTEPTMRVPEHLDAELARRVRADHAGTMFVDPDKLAMFSAEMTIGTDPAAYRPEQGRFEEGARALLAEHDRTADFQVDSTIISSDVEHATSGKDLGARRAWDLIAADGELPVRWLTCGDSRTDYAMADWLHDRGAAVTHVDVRPADGVPGTDYPVWTARDLADAGHGTPDAVHESVGLALLEWAANAVGVLNTTGEDGSTV